MSRIRESCSSDRSKGAVRLKMWLLWVLGVLIAPVGARAQMRLPVAVVATNEIRDEYGHVMKGNSAQDPSQRYLVQILWASNSVIYPPAYDGTPDPRNPPVESGTISIGHLISPAIAEPGRFCAMLGKPRPPQNSRFFARVYNAPTISAASFYADSQVMTVNNNDVLIAEFDSSVQPIDPRDFDDDGLNNSWEKSLDSDPNNPDTDGDHVNDYEEFLAGTDLSDEKSYFATVWLEADQDGNAWLYWSSVSGKRYQVQYTDEAHPGEYVDWGSVVTATNSVTSAYIPEGASNERRFYRVKLVQE